MILIAFMVISLLGKGVFTEATGFFQDVLEKMSEAIGVNVNLCRERMPFSDTMIAQFYNFWNTEVNLNDQNMGCVIKCVLQDLELVTPRLNLRMENANAFTEASGANELMTKAMTDLYSMCRSIAKGSSCTMALEIARCFRAGIFQLDWQPHLSMEEDEDYDLF